MNLRKLSPIPRPLFKHGILKDALYHYRLFDKTIVSKHPPQAFKMAAIMNYGCVLDERHFQLLGKWSPKK